MVSTMRRYGAAIALVSGLYSLWQSFAGPGMGLATLVMLLLGVVVIVHGLVLLTGFADRLGGYSGPLMVVWAVLMLLNQAWFAVMRDSMAEMGGRMSGMSDGMADGMLVGADAGMVALAVLMLVSGLIMLTGDEETDADEM